MIKRIFSSGMILFFLATSVIGPQTAWAQTFVLPEPGMMVGPSAEFAPVMIKGLKVHPENPLLFDFIVDMGNSGLSAETRHASALRKESEKLIKYFLTALTIKENDLWVNLSPYEHDRIIPEELGKTDLGADMLAQDYMLKQLTASLVYPGKDLGQAFWKRVYEKAQEQFGTTDIPVDTFNKVWIMADRAKVLERNNAAFIVDAHLKVMLETDYLATTKTPMPGSQTMNTQAAEDSVLTSSHELAKDILREIIIPEIEKEVNLGQNFAPLRQIFYSMILATWFQVSLKEAFLNQVYSHKSKTRGVLLDDQQIKEKIYARYMAAYKKGVFNLIKEDIAGNGAALPRKYFSGGIPHDFAMMTSGSFQIIKELTPGARLPLNKAALVTTDFSQSADVAPDEKSEDGEKNQGKDRAAVDPLAGKTVIGNFSPSGKKKTTAREVYNALDKMIIAMESATVQKEGTGFFARKYLRVRQGRVSEGYVVDDLLTVMAKEAGMEIVNIGDDETTLSQVQSSNEHVSIGIRFHWINTISNLKVSSADFIYWARALQKVLAESDRNMFHLEDIVTHTREMLPDLIDADMTTKRIIQMLKNESHGAKGLLVRLKSMDIFRIEELKDLKNIDPEAKVINISQLRRQEVRRSLTGANELAAGQIIKVMVSRNGQSIYIINQNSGIDVTQQKSIQGFLKKTSGDVMLIQIQKDMNLAGILAVRVENMSVTDEWFPSVCYSSTLVVSEERIIQGFLKDTNKFRVIKIILQNGASFGIILDKVNIESIDHAMQTRVEFSISNAWFSEHPGIQSLGKAIEAQLAASGVRLVDFSRFAITVIPKKGDGIRSRETFNQQDFRFNEKGKPVTPLVRLTRYWALPLVHRVVLFSGVRKLTKDEVLARLRRLGIAAVAIRQIMDPFDPDMPNSFISAEGDLFLAKVRKIIVDQTGRVFDVELNEKSGNHFGLVLDLPIISQDRNKGGDSAMSHNRGQFDDVTSSLGIAEEFLVDAEIKLGKALDAQISMELMSSAKMAEYSTLGGAIAGGLKWTLEIKKRLKIFKALGGSISPVRAKHGEIADLPAVDLVEFRLDKNTVSLIAVTINGERRIIFNKDNDLAPEWTEIIARYPDIEPIEVVEFMVAVAGYSARDAIFDKTVDVAEVLSLSRGFKKLREIKKDMDSREAEVLRGEARVFFEDAVRKKEKNAHKNPHVLQIIAEQWRGDQRVLQQINSADKLMQQLKDAQASHEEFSSAERIDRDVVGVYHAIINIKKPELLETISQPDSAQVIDGGIDLKTKNMPLDVVKDGNGVKITIDPAQLERFRRDDFKGIVPVIINITPITSAFPILGMADPDTGSDSVKS